VRHVIDCVEALAFNIWRDHITNTIHTAVFEWRLDNSTILLGIRDKLAHFEDEFPKLKEATTIVESGNDWVTAKIVLNGLDRIFRILNLAKQGFHGR